MRDDFTGTLANADIADRELAIVAPIGLESRIFVMSGNLGQVIDHAFDLDFANPLDKGLERFTLLALRHIPTRKSLHDLRNSLRWNRAHRQAV